MEVTAETVLNDLLEQIKKLILENSMLRAALAQAKTETIDQKPENPDSLI